MGKMRNMLALIAVVIFYNIAGAAEVKPDVAQVLAERFFSSLKGENYGLVLVKTCKISQITKSGKTEEIPLYYQFNAENGFIIVAADDVAFPVLGYSTSSKMDVSQPPYTFQKWMEIYKKQIIYIKQNNLKANKKIKQAWSDIITGDYPVKSSKGVSPLISAKWGQGTYYNAKCPYDAGAGQYVLTGCVATAMAQIMRYYSYPAQGNGFHSYNHPYFGTLSANFGATTYNWGSMPAYLTGANDAVATLMYHCGVSVNMYYSVNGSGAYTEDVVYALENYFNYDASARYVIKLYYSDAAWKSMLTGELDAGRPVHYAGYGNEGGHAFVCDGYQNTDYFHFNWGWSGGYDGYYYLSSLNPGTANFTQNQAAVVGIKPPGGTVTYDIGLNAAITITPNPIDQGEPFEVWADVANFSTTQTFNGDLCAALFSSTGEFIDYIETIDIPELPPNSHFTGGVTFSTSGMSAFTGSYSIGVFYRPDGRNWVLVDEKSFTNPVDINISSGPNDLQMYADFNIIPRPVVKNNSFSLEADIINNGGSAFNGDLALVLYDSEGTFLEEIEKKEGMNLCSGCHYQPDLIFSSSGIDQEPGTYILALWGKPDGGDWTLIGNDNYSNPEYIQITDEPLSADIYEDNNSMDDAYNIVISFSGDNLTKTTPGSNLHSSNDIDFYTMQLPEGYDYEIDARVHDSHNSGDGNVYTVDVQFAYKAGVTWSSFFDDIESTPLNLDNGGQVVFRVQPYIQNMTGTYNLEIQISRTKIVDNIISARENSNNYSVFPNPADNFIHITSNSKQISEITIINMPGTVVYKSYLSEPKQIIPVQGLIPGIYFIQIKNKNKIVNRKIIID